MKRLSCLLLLLITLSGYSQSGLLWSNPIIVADGSTYGNTHPKIILTNNNSPLVVWSNTLPATIYTARWNGSGFNAPITVSPSGIEPYTNNWTSAEMDGVGDSVFIVYKTSPLTTGNVYLHRSTDGGNSFNDTLRINNIGTDIAFLPTIGVTPGGNPVVTFMRQDLVWNNPRYVTANSLDGGATFLPDVPASTVSGTDVCDCCPARIINQGARQTLLFRNNDNNLRDLWVAVSNDNGTSFPAGADIDPNGWIINACPASGPDGIIVGDSVYAVWMSGASGANRVWITSVHLGNIQIGQNMKIAGSVPAGTSQNYPNIAGNSDTIGVAWEQNYSGDINCVFSYSTTGISGLLGGGFDTVNASISGIQRNPDVAYANGKFYFVWQDDQNNNVMFRTASVVAVGINEIHSSNSIKLYPNPASSTFTISSNIAIPAEIELYDIAGRQVLQYSINDHQSLIDVSHLSKGMYLWNLGVARGKIVLE